MSAQGVARNWETVLGKSCGISMFPMRSWPSFVLVIVRNSSRAESKCVGRMAMYVKRSEGKAENRLP